MHFHDQSFIHSERPWQEKEPRGSSPVRSVVLPPNLHLLSLNIPGWNYSSNHNVHLNHVHSGEQGENPGRMIICRFDICLSL